MTGFDSKRTAALDKLAEVTEEMGLYKETVSKDEALKLALEALEYRGASTWLKHGIAVAAIKEALAQPAQKSLKEMTEADFDAAHDIGQPAQEPVAHVIVIGDMVSVSTGSSGLKDLFELGNGAPLYTTPPQRPWVGLTDEDELDWEEGGNLKDLVKAIEAKLKEKNTP